MPLQDYSVRILWAFATISLLVEFLGPCEAGSLKNGISMNKPLQPDDGITSELKALPAQEREKIQGSDISSAKVGYDKAAMLFMKRYVEGLRKPSKEAYHTNHKKSIYGPGMYPFYGLYGKRVIEDSRYGYNPEVMDMIRGLIERTEAAAAKERAIEKLRKQLEGAKNAASGGKSEIKYIINSQGKKLEESKGSNKELNQVVHPAVNIKDKEDMAAKVTAYQDVADEKTLEELKDPEATQNKH